MVAPARSAGPRSTRRTDREVRPVPPPRPLTLALALELSDAPPLAQTTLVVGTSLLAAPFKGGTLGPQPGLLLPLPVDADGGVTISAAFPAGLPSGVALYLQCWTPDAGAPAGLSASNTLVATTP